jgi:hypothetical protein
VGQVHLTLLIENLSRLAAEAPDHMRYPALELAWARGEPCQRPSHTPDHLRFALFGIEPEGSVPVAALTHVNDRRKRGSNPRANYYWLRVDPVTVWADMARVFMTSYGFADLDPYERNEVESVVRGVLDEEGIHLHGDHPERWCIALEQPLQFGFTPLQEALGMDLGETLPDHPEARYWRRVLTEIQVALHHSPVNARRRSRGQREVNSVWFWGGGFIPDAAEHYLLDTVYSDHPVTRGLALINDCGLHAAEAAVDSDFAADGRAVLVDWDLPAPDPAAALAELELLVGRLLVLARHKRVELTLYNGSGEGRCYGAGSRHRFWRRRAPLSAAFASVAGT